MRGRADKESLEIQVAEGDNRTSNVEDMIRDEANLK
jgi:hypothetical protein